MIAIRDKIAASKRKGLWVGGTLPLGYHMKDEKIAVIEDEAERVRLIYRRYLELDGVNALARDLRERNIRTKSRLLATGATRGGILFGRGSLAGVGASHAAVLITEDRGGRIGAYMDKYQGLRSSGETVVIDGFCASACTIILAAVPHDKICVTSYANLGFHAAWDFGPKGRTITNREATQMLYSMYPSPIRRWIAQRGGLTSQMIYLRGKQLARMYKPCYLDAQASAPR